MQQYLSILVVVASTLFIVKRAETNNLFDMSAFLQCPISVYAVGLININ